MCADLLEVINPRCACAVRVRVVVLCVCVCVVYVGVSNVLVRKVRDVWEWLNCMHIDTSEGGAVMPRCGFQSVRYLEVKYIAKMPWDQG